MVSVIRVDWPKFSMRTVSTGGPERLPAPGRAGTASRRPVTERKENAVMKKGARLVGSFLVLCAGATPVFSQDSSWRPATPLQPVAPAALTALRPCPAVTLGKPVLLP